jgi:hypothetical protein
MNFNCNFKMILARDPGPYDDPFGPVMLAVMLICALTINFFMNLLVGQ